MSTTVCSLLAVCVVACVMHRASVVSQCTTKHCHDGDNDVRELTALVYRLQDSLEQQQQQNLENMEQQQKHNQEQQEQLTRHEEILAKQDEIIRELKKTSIPSGTDCADLLKRGHSTSGVYSIRLAGKTVQVFCDMSTDNGGWLVFQRRVDNKTDFYRDWKSYKEGFGDLTRNFWLGNDHLHAITAQKNYSLRVDLGDFEGATRYAVYTNFAVGDEDNKYRLSLGSYQGTAGDSLTYHNGMAFSTRDRDNDKSVQSCAQIRKGGWWYNRCNHSNLNGLYLDGANTEFDNGINWHRWHGFEYSLKTVEMKLRPQ